MPKLKQKKKDFPPINKLRACILDRKFSTRMTWEDIGQEAGVSPDYLRKLMSTKDPWDWESWVLEAVCKALDIGIKRTVEDGWLS